MPRGGRAWLLIYDHGALEERIRICKILVLVLGTHTECNCGTDRNGMEWSRVVWSGVESEVVDSRLRVAALSHLLVV